MLLGSKQHTAGDTRRWQLDYSHWLDNTATIVSVDVASSSLTCTANGNTVLGKEAQFFLTGGVQGETLVVSVAMTDSFANVKNDTIAFTVVSP